MLTDQNESVPQTSRCRLSLPVLLLLLVSVFVIAVRLRAINLTLERDEGEYGYAGQLMLQGIPPYKLFYNMKMPGIYAAYALIMAVFGQTTTGIHLGLLLFNLATIWLVYILARNFFESGPSAAAGAVYAIMSTSPAVFGYSTHATHFVVLVALSGLLLLLRGQRTGQALWFLLSGLLFGLAFLMKQPGIFFGLFAAGWLVWSTIADKNTWRRTHLQRILMLGLGGIIPILLTCAILWRAGVFEKFWFWTVTYATAHGTAASIAFGWKRLNLYFSVIGVDIWFWLLALLGFVLLLKEKTEQRAKKIFLGGFFISSAAAVCPSFHFSMHYFVLALPAVALLIAEFIVTIPDYLPWPVKNPVLRQWPSGLIAVVWLSVMGLHRDVFFFLTPVQLSQTIFHRGNRFLEFAKIARYLEEHTTPTDRIAVLGSEPEVFFYAHRHSATGYIYMYDLVQAQPYTDMMQHDAIREIEQSKPLYFIFVNNKISWSPQWPLSQSIIAPWYSQYAGRYYDAVGAVNLSEPAEYYWGPNAEAHASPVGSVVLVYKRKSGL